MVNKSASQSSTAYSAPANRALDGITDGTFSDNSCTHTNSELNPWWRGDLTQSIKVTTVKVFNRVDCCSDRLTNYFVTVGDNTDVSKNTQCGGKVYTGTQNVTCNLVGRYVGIMLNNTNYLTLCEVEVFSTALYDKLYTQNDFRMVNLTSLASTASLLAYSKGSFTPSRGPGFHNLLSGAFVTQSSTGYGGLATLANDGTINTNFISEAFSCSHTGYDKNAWWKADMKYSQKVT
jgi:hypothetical protein